MLPPAALEPVETVAGEPVLAPVRALLPARPPAPAAALAAGGFAAGVLSTALLRRRRVRRAARRRRTRAGMEMLQVLNSRSFLIDVHLLGRE